MILKCSTLTEFIDYTKNKNIFCICASKHMQKVKNREWFSRVACFIDNNSGGKFKIEGYPIEWNIKSYDYLREVDSGILLITSKFPATTRAVLQQLQKMELPDSFECFNVVQIEECVDLSHEKIDDNFFDTEPQINKIIHSFWFSDDKKPNYYKKCIDSWKRYCPDYEIKEWNSNNYDYSKNRYMIQAYKYKKWAYVSDVARLDVVYNYGGIYLDMDVELLKPLDPLLYLKCFFAKDSYGRIDLGSGFGAAVRHPLVGKLLKKYDNVDFWNGEGTPMSKDLINQPTFLLPVLEKEGYRKDAYIQYLEDAVCLSPEFFRVINDRTMSSRNFSGYEYGIHWHQAGWFEEDRRKESNRRQRELNQFLKEYYEICIK